MTDPRVGSECFPELTLGLCSVDLSSSDCKYVPTSALVYLHPVLTGTIPAPQTPTLYLAPLCPLLLSEPGLVNRSFMWQLLSYFMAFLSWAWHQVPPVLCWEIIQMSLLRATTIIPLFQWSTSVCGPNRFSLLGQVNALPKRLNFSLCLPSWQL